MTEVPGNFRQRPLSAFLLPLATFFLILNPLAQAAPRNESRLQLVDRELSLKPVPNQAPRLAPLEETLPMVAMRFLAAVRAPQLEGDATALQASGFALSGTKAYVSYLMAGETIHGGLDVLDLSDPRNPRIELTLLSRQEEFADVVASGDWIYAVGATNEGNGGGVLAVYKASSRIESVARLPLGGFAANRIRLSGSNGGSTAWISVGDNMGLAEVDLSNPASPRLVTLAQLPNSLDVLPFHGGVLGLGGETQTEISLWNGSFLESVFRVAAFPTRAPARMAMRDHLLFTNAGKTGFTILDFTTARTPRTLWQGPLPGTGAGLALSGPFTLLAQGDAGLIVTDVARPDQPETLGMIDFGNDSGSANATAAERIGDRNYVLLADGLGGFKILVLGGKLPIAAEQRACFFCVDQRDANLQVRPNYTVQVPAEIPVTQGTAGQGTATLGIGPVECTYRGAAPCEHPMPDTDEWRAGRRYVFESCTDGSRPGAHLPAQGSVRLKSRRGIWGLNSHIRAEALLDLGVVEVSGAAR